MVRIEVKTCQIRRGIDIAGNPNTQEIIGWNAEVLLLMSIVLYYIHFIGKDSCDMMAYIEVLNFWSQNSTIEIDSEEKKVDEKYDVTQLIAWSVYVHELSTHIPWKRRKVYDLHSVDTWYFGMVYAS